MWNRVILVMAILILASALASARFAGTLLRHRYPSPGRMVSVGTHNLNIYCTGKGSPAIVLESGLAADWRSWYRVAPELSGMSQVCVYDRAGYGWSEPGPKPRTALQLSGELHSLLANAGVPEPYVLAAHSFGAYVARVFAARFSGCLIGLVLVDPSHEDEPKINNPERRIRNWLPPTGLPGLLHLYSGETALPADLPAAYRARFLVGATYDEAVAARAEFDSLPVSEAQARTAVFPPGLPLTVITATYIVTTGHPGAPQLKVGPLHLELQAQLARLSSRGKQVVAERSGHDIQFDRPELVVRAIREMVPGTR